MPYFLLQHRDDPTQVVEISPAQPELTIGRAAESHLRLHHTSVSRHHAIVIYQDGAYIFFDRNSSNGSYLNEKRIDRGILHHGDTIECGDVVLYFRQDVPHTIASRAQKPARLFYIVRQHEALVPHSLSLLARTRGDSGGVCVLAHYSHANAAKDPLQPEISTIAARGEHLHGHQHPALQSVQKTLRDPKGGLYLISPFLPGNPGTQYIPTHTAQITAQITAHQIHRGAAMALAACEAWEHLATHMPQGQELVRDINPHSLWHNPATNHTWWRALAWLSPPLPAENAPPFRGGTVECAPERFTNLPSHTATRDCFRLGMLLFQLTTGVHPLSQRIASHNAHTAPAQHKILGDAMGDRNHFAVAWPLPSDYVPHYPQELEEIVIRALAWNPRDRYTRPAALAHALRNYLQQNAISYVQPPKHNLDSTLTKLRVLFEEGNHNTAAAYLLEHPRYLQNPRVQSFVWEKAGRWWSKRLWNNVCLSDEELAFLAVFPPAIEAVEGLLAKNTTEKHRYGLCRIAALMNNPRLIPLLKRAEQQATSSTLRLLASRAIDALSQPPQSDTLATHQRLEPDWRETRPTVSRSIMDSIHNKQTLI